VEKPHRVTGPRDLDVEGFFFTRLEKFQSFRPELPFGVYRGVDITPVEIQIEGGTRRQSLHRSIGPAAVADDDHPAPLEVFDEVGGVSFARARNLVLGIQQIVTVHASMRVNEVDGIAFIVIRRLEQCGAVAHVVELVDDLETPLQQRIEIGRKDRPAERCSVGPLFLRPEDARQKDVSTVDSATAAFDGIPKVLPPHLVAEQPVGHQGLIGKTDGAGIRQVRESVCRDRKVRLRT
jgi:hypothetical protein